MVCPCLCGRHLSARNCSCSFPAATTNPAPAGLTSHLPGLVRLTASLITNHHQPSGFTSVRSIGAGGAAGSSAPAPACCIDTSDGTTAALRKVALIAAKYWLHRYVRRSTDRGHGRHSALGGRVITAHEHLLQHMLGSIPLLQGAKGRQHRGLSTRGEPELVVPCGRMLHHTDRHNLLSPGGW